MTVASVTPGLFSANSSGQGVAVGIALLYKANGTYTAEPLIQLNSSTGTYTAVPLSVATGTDQLYLVLFGTGFRNAVERQGDDRRCDLDRDVRRRAGELRGTGSSECANPVELGG